METHEHIMAYYPLFEHMQSEHGLTLLESELQEIIRLSDEVKQKYNKASNCDCVKPEPYGRYTVMRNCCKKCNKSISTK